MRASMAKRLGWSVVLLVAGCASTSSQPFGNGTACTPGASVSCACQTGSTGAQVCAANGSGYGACDCAGVSDEGSDSGSDSSVSGVSAPQPESGAAPESGTIVPEAAGTTPPPSSCSETCSGCCDATDTCQTGTSTSQCGVGGASCTICLSGYVCSGTCQVAPAVDAGQPEAEASAPEPVTIECEVTRDYPQNPVNVGAECSSEQCSPSGTGVMPCCYEDETSAVYACGCLDSQAVETLGYPADCLLP